MKKKCTVIKTFRAKEVTEGAGVRLKRVFGYSEVPHFDPFLLLDHFESENTDDFRAGFPFHPHRGIETITYLKKGSVEHQDKLGNKSLLTENQVQWMKTGSGIFHQEMPGTDSGINGFQLWLNMPPEKKMQKAEYFVFKNIPEYRSDTGTVRIISGTFQGVTGPGTSKNSQNMVYLDMEVRKNLKIELEVCPEAVTFIYIYRGSLNMDKKTYSSGEILLFNKGELVEIAAESSGAEILFISANPFHEPVAWWGPVVMNTEEEIKQAKEDLANGNFPGS